VYNQLDKYQLSTNYKQVIIELTMKLTNKQSLWSN